MKRRILTAALSVLLAVVGTTAVLIYVNQANTRALAGQKAVTVLVATKQIPSGTTAQSAMQEGLLASQRLPASSVPADALRALSPAQDALVLSADVAPGQLLLAPMLVPAAQVTGGIAIPSGMVAVSIQLCLPEAVADAVRPGSQVAVFDTYSGGSLSAQPNCEGPHQQQDPGSVHTRLVIPSVLVLSVGENEGGQAGTQATSASDPAPDNTASSQGTVLVTLAVSQADAERVIQLTEAGLPYLALLTGSSVTKPDSSLVPLLYPLS